MIQTGITKEAVSQEHCIRHLDVQGGEYLWSSGRQSLSQPMPSWAPYLPLNSCVISLCLHCLTHKMILGSVGSSRGLCVPDIIVGSVNGPEDEHPYPCPKETSRSTKAY